MEAALQAAIDNRPDLNSVGDTRDKPPETELSAMLRDAAQVPYPPATRPASPRSPIDMNLVSQLTAIERLVTPSAQQARRNAYDLIGERDAALADLDPSELLRRIERFRSLLSA